MEQYLGHRQFVTLLLHLDAICIFAPTIELLLCHIELVFNRLKEFHFKITSKNAIFDTHGPVLSSRGISANSKKVEMVGDWPVPQMQRRYIPF